MTHKAIRAIYFSIALILFGAISVSARFILDDPSNLPAGDEAWELHWEFIFTGGDPGSEVRVVTPIDTRHTQVFEQDITLEGMRIRRNRISKDGTREIVARVIYKQDVKLKADFAVRVSQLGIPHYIKKKDVLNAERRQLYISSEEYLPSSNEEVLALLQSILKDVDEPELIFEALFEYCKSKIKNDARNVSNNVLDIIHKKSTSVRGKVRLLTTLARAAKIPARMVMGLILETEGELLPHYWLEINVNDSWLAYDPSNGFLKELPVNYLPIRKDGESFLVMPESMSLKYMSLETVKRDVTIDFSDIEKKLSDILDLNRLSLSTRLTLSFLLLLPLGALLTIFVRQIVGPNVYGTFTPTFFAMAFTHVGWKTGGIILFIVTIIGVIGRSFTPLLGLNRISRLTIVFILVAISTIFCVSLMVYYGVIPDGNIVLLPIVILTYMIDRIYKLADAGGVSVAMLRLFWTMVVAALVGSILQFEILGLWLLKYPEAHLITAAFVIIISQYKGQQWMRKIGLGGILEPEELEKRKLESQADF